MALIWKYSNAGKSTKNHAFIQSSESTSICGYHIPWYHKVEWFNNEEGLEARENCKRCLHVDKVVNFETPLNLIPRTPDEWSDHPAA